MNNVEFDKVVNQITNEIKEVLSSKANEYARGDRLSNFKQAAKIRNITPESALLGMDLKHRVAIYDFVNDLDNDHCMPMTQIHEKILDSINYLILLYALFLERKAVNNEESEKSEKTIKNGITHKWNWMMDYCQLRNLTPASNEVWLKAEKAYHKCYA